MCNLIELHCTDTPVNKLYISNAPNLTKLSCCDNKIKELNLSGISKLTTLWCFENHITELDISNVPNLRDLACDGSLLTKLDLSSAPNLTALTCEEAQLAELDLSNVPNLTKLCCRDNKLPELDLTKVPNLCELDCSGNQLTNLNLSDVPKLTKLNCRDNLITVLDVTANAALTKLRHDASVRVVKRPSQNFKRHPPKITVNQLTFSGTTWAVRVNGESTVLQLKNEEGVLRNLQNPRVVVLDWNETKERGYYKKGWDGSARPDCWSPDGKRPHSSVQNPQSIACETCPMSATDGKIRKDGKGLAACGEYRILVVVPRGNQDFPALKFTLSITSDFDGRDDEATAQGWYSWKNYVDYLNVNGLDCCGVVTEIRFSNLNLPKVQFKLAGLLEVEDFKKCALRAKTKEVQKLVEAKGIADDDE